MGDTPRMEAERIRTLRPVWYLALAAVLVGALASASVATSPPRGALSGETTRSVITGGSSAAVLPFVGLPILFMGVAAVLEDTRHKLATVLLVAQPRRTRLMAARLVVLAAIAAPVCLVQMLSSAAIAVAMGRTPAFDDIPAIAVAHLAAVVVFAWVDAALAWLTGTAAAPVWLVLLDMLLLEPLVKVAGVEYSDELENWARRLPFTAARDALSYEPAAVLFSLAYALALLGAAWAAVRVRDY